MLFHLFNVLCEIQTKYFNECVKIPVDWTFTTNLTKMHDKELNGHRNLLMFSLNEYCCVGKKKWVNCMIGANATMKDIYLCRWSEPAFRSFSCIQSHFCSFKFLFNKPVNGRMFLQDGQRWGTNKIQHAYKKEKQQNRWVRQQRTASARNVAAGVPAGEVLQMQLWCVWHKQRPVKTSECMFRIYWTMWNFKVCLRISYSSIIQI